MDTKIIAAFTRLIDGAKRGDAGSVAILVGGAAAIVGLGAVLVRRKSTASTATAGAASSDDDHAAGLMGDWGIAPPKPVFRAVVGLGRFLKAAADALTPPPFKVFSDAQGAFVTQVQYVCIKLELADRIGTVRGGCTTGELAAAVGASEESLARLLRAASSLGYFRLDPDTGKWRNTAPSAALRRDHPNGCRALPLHLVEDTYECWSRLLDSVVTGRSNFAIPAGVATRLGIPALHTPPGGGDDAAAVVLSHPGTAPASTGSDLVAVDLWRWYQARGAHSVQFNEAMTAVDALGWYAQTHDYPWGQHTRAVDVGGSLGSLLAHILAAHPGLKGLLFDQPHVIDEARPVWAAKHAPLLPRVDFASGSFFDAPTLPPAADGDVWFLRNILHDWSDEHSATILRNIRTAFGSTTRATLAIVEVTPAEVGDVPARCLLDLHMMVVVRGKERTPRQWAALLAGAGFKLVTVHDTRSLIRIVEAVPV